MTMNQVEFLDRLIQTPSPSYHEQEAAKLCEQYLKQFPFKRAWIDEAGNAVATNYEPAAGVFPDLLLFSHMDTIAAPMPYNREDGRIYGRGAVDAKASLAALLTAGGQMAGKVPYKLMVAGVTEEEAPTSKGIRHLLATAKPKIAINGEPSNTDGITIAYKGRLVVECTTHGQAAHAGMAAENPIERTLEYYNKLRLVFPKHKTNFDSVIMNLTHIEAGSKDALNVVPETLDFEIDVRVPPSMPNEKVISVFKKLAPKSVRVEVHESIPGVETDMNSPLCKAMVASMRECGIKPRYVKKSGSADMNVTIEAGVPTIAYGPGDSSLDHTLNEVVLVSDYEKSVEVLCGAIARLESAFRQ